MPRLLIDGEPDDVVAELFVSFVLFLGAWEPPWVRGPPGPPRTSRAEAQQDLLKQPRLGHDMAPLHARPLSRNPSSTAQIVQNRFVPVWGRPDGNFVIC